MADKRLPKSERKKIVSQRKQRKEAEDMKWGKEPKQLEGYL